MASDLYLLLHKLVSYDTSSQNLDDQQECFKYLSDYLRKVGLKVTSLSSNGIPSLVASTKADKNQRLLLQAHIDVVPGKPEQYALIEKDSKLYGRGVYDMKFAVACYLKLVEDLKDDLHKYNFGIMLTADEEVGGQNGVKFLLEQGYRAEVCILPDGGDEWRIEASCNGIWFAKLISQGKTAHGSRPWEGNCAIEHLLDAVTRIRGVFGPPSMAKSTVIVSQIQGGAAINQVADYAEATLDMRFIDKQEYESKRKKVESIADDLGLKCQTIAQVDSCMADLEHPQIARFLQVAERVRGQPIGKTHSLGASDAHYFAKHNIPTILIRPEGGGHHGPHEWVDKQSLNEFYEVLKAYVIEAARI